MNVPDSSEPIASGAQEPVAAQPYVEQKVDMASLLSIRYPRGAPKHSIDEIRDALVNAAGNIAAAARALGARRSSLKERIDSDPDLTLILSELREEVCDQAESNIFTSVFSGDMQSSQFVLKTIGRDRGYVPGVAISGTLRTISSEPVMDEKEWANKYGSADLGTTTGTAESPD